MPVTLVDKFHGYRIFKTVYHGMRYYPVFLDGKGYWHYYSGSKGDNLSFASLGAVLSFFERQTKRVR